MGVIVTPGSIDVEEQATYQPARLLLIDKLRSFRTAISFVLNREPDLRVVADVGSVSETHDLVRTCREQIDIAVVELQLPDGVVADLIDPLFRAWPECRILALTAIPDRRVHAQAIAAGLLGVLHKSVSIEEILEAIRRVHRGEPMHSPDELVSLLRMASRHGSAENAAQTALNRLTPREREILTSLADGLSDKEIAARLHVSINTVAAHMAHMLSKLGVRSRLQAVLLAIKYGAVDLR